MAATLQHFSSCALREPVPTQLLARGSAHPGESPLARALRRLQSLTDSDRGVLEVTACGAAAIPALRAIVLAPDPTGLYRHQSAFA